MRVTERLEGLFPYRRLWPLLLAATATGLWLWAEPRFGDTLWGWIQWLHVVLGPWLLVAALGYLLHHVPAKLGSQPAPRDLLAAAVLVVALAVVLVTGALLALAPPTGGASVALRAWHRGASWVGMAAASVHVLAGGRALLGALGAGAASGVRAAVAARQRRRAT